MINITHFKLLNKPPLIATFNVVIPKWGNFVIRECAYFEKGDGGWITFPSKQYEKDGKKKFFAYVAFEDREIQDKFLEQVKSEVKRLLGNTPKEFEF